MPLRLALAVSLISNSKETVLSCREARKDEAVKHFSIVERSCQMIRSLSRQKKEALKQRFRKRSFAHRLAIRYNSNAFSEMPKKAKEKTRPGFQEKSFLIRKKEKKEKKKKKKKTKKKKTKNKKEKTKKTKKIKKPRRIHHHCQVGGTHDYHQRFGEQDRAWPRHHIQVPQWRECAGEEQACDRIRNL
ncbi:MAG: hypothetical protein LBT59_15870 [Clostridiales bacterium]|nr:hypothetical protein [Clostridiales bacterium]